MCGSDAIDQVGEKLTVEWMGSCIKAAIQDLVSRPLHVSANVLYLGPLHVLYLALYMFQQMYCILALSMYCISPSTCFSKCIVSWPSECIVSRPLHV